MFEFIKVHIVLFSSKWSSFGGRFRMLVCFVVVTSNLVLRMCWKVVWTAVRDRSSDSPRLMHKQKYHKNYVMPFPRLKPFSDFLNKIQLLQKPPVSSGPAL